MPSILLYTRKNLQEIEANLLAGKTKFPITIGSVEYKCYFGRVGNRYIQRIDNVTLGLTYDMDGQYFILNYPHLNNIRDAQIEDLTGMVGKIDTIIVEEKLNGTNVGVVRPLGNLGAMGSLIVRCRGSIEPETFINDINKAIILKEPCKMGVNDDVWKSFAQKYTPILEQGMKEGYINNYGCFNMSKIIGYLKTDSVELLDMNPEVIGVFGELVSKYNPIAVDGELRFGMYLDSDIPYNWVIFNIMERDQNGNIWLTSEPELTQKYGLDHVKSITLRDLGTCLTEFSSEEGVIIKGYGDQYLKMKQSEVKEYASKMAKIATVIDSSATHIFEQGLGFTRADVFENQVLRNKDTIDGIRKQVMSEIEENGIKREHLVEYYFTRLKIKDKNNTPEADLRAIAENEIDYAINDRIAINLMMLVAPMLKEAGIGKEKLYLEIPRYITFEREPLFIDDKKKKWRANTWYAKMLGTTIGRCYLQ